MSVQDVLRIDAQHRMPVVAGAAIVPTDLTNLDSVVFNKPWDYSLPTLTDKTDSKFQQLNSAEFAATFYKKYPYLEHIDWSHLCLAGGSICSLICNKQPNDLDFFIHRLDSEAKATEYVQGLLQSIVKNLCQEEATSGNFSRAQREVRREIVVTEQDLRLTYIRNKYTITMLSKERKIKIQFILRVYNCISEILHGFDLGSSAIGFDGTNVYLTSLGKFAYEYGCNIIDTTRRSLTYETRLVKYLSRSFKIVMPELDMSKLSLERSLKYGLAEVCELPFFVFSYRVYNSNHNRLVLDHIYQPATPAPRNREEYAPEVLNQHVAFVQNIRALISGKFDNLFHVTTNSHQIMENRPGITMDNVVKWYRNKLGNLTNPHELNLRLLRNWFSVEPLEKIVQGLIVPDEKQKEIFARELVAKQIELLHGRFAEMMEKNTTNTGWLTTDVTKQQSLLTGFNPIIEDPEKWYGQHYRKNC